MSWRTKAGIALASVLPLSACTDGQAATSGAAIVIQVDGYPLDRTLNGFVNWGGLEFAAVVGDVKKVETLWTTATGEAPAYLLEGRAPTEAEGAVPATIVTRFEGVVTEALAGDAAVGTVVSFFVGGGTIGRVTVQASDEIAPNTEQLAASKSVVIGGSYTQVQSAQGVDVAFAYTVSNGSVVSLMQSGSDKQPEFTMDQLRAALAAKLR